ncbi:hypothetical protein ebA341 [Aromatoleum aromaticum EbN1]|uniref:Uncharacterized protein n=1 Tax=Aromatoleum aromaticum (strain DSM 19018 / LMG 30748 / EbN1) TaxID=76114 RepID=Q5P8Q9_AROAE|nr:hypothetical protein ebA341 [Aromatoleum aromaticum EbN1]
MARPRLPPDRDQRIVEEGQNCHRLLRRAIRAHASPYGCLAVCPVKEGMATAQPSQPARLPRSSLWPPEHFSQRDQT